MYEITQKMPKGPNLVRAADIFVFGTPYGSIDLVNLGSKIVGFPGDNQTVIREL